MAYTREATAAVKLSGLGFRVWGLGFGVWGLGFRVTPPPPMLEHTAWLQLLAYRNQTRFW